MAIGLTTQQLTWVQLSVELAAVSPLAAHGHLQAAGELTAHGAPRVCDDHMVARLAEDLCRARLHRDMTAAGSQALARSAARHADRPSVQVDPEGRIVSAPPGWRTYKLDLSGTAGVESDSATTGPGSVHAPVVQDGKADGGPVNSTVPLNGKNHTAVAVGFPVIAVQTPSSNYQELVTRGSDVIQAEFSQLQAKKQRVYDAMQAVLQPLLDTLQGLRGQVARNREEVTRLTAERQSVGRELGPLYAERKKIEREGGDLAEIDSRLNPIKERAQALGARINELLMEAELAAKATEIQAAILPFEEPILALLRREGDLVSWTIHAAVQFSDPENANYSMGEFYQYVATAAQAYRGSVAFDEEAGLKVFARAFEDQGFSLGIALNEAHQTRVQLRDAMTLPETQRGCGQLYNVREELRALDLEGLADQIPDRVPLPVRFDFTKEAPTPMGFDKGYFEQPQIVRMYDVAIRSEISFPLEGEVLDSDVVITVMMSGTGTANSTLESMARWQGIFIGHYGRGGGKRSRHNQDRKATAIGLAQPFHGFGNRDPKLAALREDAAHPTLESLADRTFVMTYVNSMRDRYAGYNRAMVLVGRSTGGFIARAHRLIFQNTPSAFDGYINMSGFPFVNPQTLADNFWVFFDWYVVMHISFARPNPPGFTFFLRLGNSCADLNDVPVTGTTPLVLNMASGQDGDYPPDLPPKLDTKDSGTKAWIRSRTNFLYNYFTRWYRPDESWFRLAKGYVGLILAYRALLETVMPEHYASVDAYWEDLRAGRLGFEGFFQGEQQREEQERPGDEARSTLHYDSTAYHNQLAAGLNSDETIEASRAAMFRLLDRVVAGFARRRSR